MYGANYGHSRGRRNFVPSYTYEKNGKKFTRIKFTVENDRKQPAMVYVEVDHSRPSAFGCRLPGILLVVRHWYSAHPVFFFCLCLRCR